MEADSYRALERPVAWKGHSIGCSGMVRLAQGWATFKKKRKATGCVVAIRPAISAPPSIVVPQSLIGDTPANSTKYIWFSSWSGSRYGDYGHARTVDKMRARVAEKKGEAVFLTLTVRPEWGASGRDIYKRWNVLRLWLSRKLDGPLSYVAALEYTKSQKPHLHIIIFDRRRLVDRIELQKKWGAIIDIRTCSPQRIRYIFAYSTKTRPDSNHWRDGARKFSCSRDISAKLPRAPSPNTTSFFGIADRPRWISAVASSGPAILPWQGRTYRPRHAAAQHGETPNSGLDSCLPIIQQRAIGGGSRAVAQRRKTIQEVLERIRDRGPPDKWGGRARSTSTKAHRRGFSSMHTASLPSVVALHRKIFQQKLSDRRLVIFNARMRAQLHG